MAHTWPRSWWKAALLAAVDFFARPAASVFRAGVEFPRHPKRILVVEIWQIGDVVLATPFLAALRSSFPDATVTLLAKPHAEELLRGTGLVDEILTAEIPWTRSSGKYSWSGNDRRLLRATVAALRARNFDLAYSARMDIREHALLASTRAIARVGFRSGGGDWMLTRAVPVDPSLNHKSRDWLALLEGTGRSLGTFVPALLRVSDQERDTARQWVAAQFPVDSAIIGIHPGASHAGKRWPLDRFERLAEQLTARRHNVIVFTDPSGYGAELGKVRGVSVSASGLREFMARVAECSVLVCNDSGPMHVGAGLGVPVVAIFERGDPDWFGPMGEGHIVLAGERAGRRLSPAPLDLPPPNPISITRVLDAVMLQMDKQTRPR